jgi:hypothetical protein
MRYCTKDSSNGEFYMSHIDLTFDSHYFLVTSKRLLLVSKEDFKLVYQIPLEIVQQVVLDEMDIVIKTESVNYGNARVINVLDGPSRVWLYQEIERAIKNA